MDRKQTLINLAKEYTQYLDNNNFAEVVKPYMELHEPEDQETAATLLAEYYNPGSGLNFEEYIEDHADNHEELVDDFAKGRYQEVNDIIWNYFMEVGKQFIKR